MDNSCSFLDKWRNYFIVPGSDIFDIINHAIMVAAIDYPIDFKQNRDQIAETLFNCTKIKFPGCDQPGFPPNCVETIDGKTKNGVKIGGSNDTKESRVENNDGQRKLVAYNMNIIQLEDTGEFTPIIVEEKRMRDEVLQIKEILDNGEEEADIVINVLLKSLKRKGLTYQILKETGIGKTVNALRYHRSKDVRDRVRVLVKDWKAIVDREWYQTEGAIAGGFTIEDAVVVKEPENTPGLIEGDIGLPVPPMDDLYLDGLTIDPTLDVDPESMKFLNGGDDLGNFPKDVEFSKRQVNITKTHPGNLNIPEHKPNTNKDSSPFPKNKLTEQKTYTFQESRKLKKHKPSIRKCISTSQTPIVFPKLPNRPKLVVQQMSSRCELTLSRPKPSEPIPTRPKPVLQPKLTSREYVPSRPKPMVQPQPPRRECLPNRPKPMSQPKINNGIKVQGKTDRDVTQKKFVKPQNDNLEATDNEVWSQDKLECAKRKLQQRYQEVDNAKKQRTIKALELKDINKQMKSKINMVASLKRNLSNGRR